MLEQALNLDRESVRESNEGRIEELPVPSVSALPERKADVLENALVAGRVHAPPGQGDLYHRKPAGRDSAVQSDLVADLAIPTQTISATMRNHILHILATVFTSPCGRNSQTAVRARAQRQPCGNRNVNKSMT